MLKMIHRKYIPFLAVIASLVIVGIVAILYLGNIYMASQGPYFAIGYRKFNNLTTIGRVDPEGYKSGFRLGDQIVEVNGEQVKSLSDLQELLDKKIGAENHIIVLRDGERYAISHKTLKFGLKWAFLMFGIQWLIGIVFICIGSFVFFTTRLNKRNLSFFIFCLCGGLVMIFFNNVRLWLKWMESFELIGFCFLPATVLHMCVYSPFEIDHQQRRSLFIVFPYALSFFLFIVITIFSILSPRPVKSFRIFLLLYLFVSIVIFIFVLFYRYLKTSFRVTKLKIKVILLGFSFGALMPLIEPVLNSIFNIYVVSNLDLITLPFITIFPLSIGYAIAKHDLFEIDVFIKRTTGYLMITASIICSYLLFIFIMNRMTENLLIQNQQIFNLLFILLVVFFFNPLVHGVQDIVDKLFYRKKYDYREPVKQLLKDMTSIFEVNHIIKRLFNILSDTIFIENVTIYAYCSEKGKYCPYNSKLNRISTDDKESIASSNVLVKILLEMKKEIQRESLYQIPENSPFRDEMLSLFDSKNVQLIFPFFMQDKLSGFMLLGKIKSGRDYNISDIELMRIVSDQVAIAIENAQLISVKIEQENLKKELKIAGEIQKRMLPEEAPQIKDISIYSYIIPSMEIGGDFYDFVEIPSGEEKKLGILLGDVSGHGIPGALLMSAAHSICQNQVLQSNEAIQVLDKSNRLIIRETKKRAFVALSYGLLLPDKRIIIANAGQPSPLYYSYKKKIVSFLENEGERFPLGIIDNPSYEPLTIDLDREDVILFYTDGIVEVKNERGELFGFERLKDLFARMIHLEPEDICNRIIAELRSFSGTNRFDDDTTLIIIKHVKAHPLDTKLLIPILSISEQLVIRSVESFAQVCSLEQEDLDQLKGQISKICKNIIDYVRLYINYKIVISIFQETLDKDFRPRRDLSGFGKNLSETSLSKDISGIKAQGSRYCLEILPRDYVLSMDDGFVNRLILFFI